MNNFDTVREALDWAENGYELTAGARVALREARIALNQIENAVKRSEPVGWWNGKETVWLEHELNGYPPPADATIPVYAAPVAQQPQYPLPDYLYPDSKDWMAGTYFERVEWLLTMYESQRLLVAEYERQLAKQPQAEAVPSIDALEQEIYEHTREFVPRSVMDWMLQRYYPAAPQKAEAVLSDVVRDAEAVSLALNRAFALGQSYHETDADSACAKFITLRNEVCAAIAQQKGQP